MSKGPPKLTTIQSKALEFIRTSLDHTGTAPTLRELCAYMGYSAIGSAQDLVAALRRKGFLHTPDRQCARSLVLSPKARALQEPSHQSTEHAYVVHCLSEAPEHGLEQAKERRIGTLRMSVGMFLRPYPSAESMYALRLQDDGMIDAGMLVGDWVVVSFQTSAEPGQIVVVKMGELTTIKRLMKDRLGTYFRSENTAYPIVRHEESDGAPQILGRVLALQRVLD